MICHGAQAVENDVEGSHGPRWCPATRPISSGDNIVYVVRIDLHDRVAGPAHEVAISPSAEFMEQAFSPGAEKILYHP